MPVLMVIIAFIILFLLMLLTLKVYSNIKVRKIMKSKRIGTYETSAALVLSYGQFNVFVNKGLRSREGVNRTKYIFDNIVVRKNGIFLVSVCPLKGKILCDTGSLWHQIYKMEDGTTIENLFPSPVEEAKARLPILYEFADEIGLNRKYIKNIVCMSSPSAVLNSEVEDTFTLDETIDYIYERKVKSSIPLIQRIKFKKLIRQGSKEKRDKRRNQIATI